METRSPIQYGRLFLSFCIVFSIFSLLFFFLPLPAPFLEIIIGEKLYLIALAILIGALSAPIAWRLYKRHFHCTFSYNEIEFTFRKGKKDVLGGLWRDFSSISLVRSNGDFSLRLYPKSGGEVDHIDLPLSKVKLDPHEFRFKVMEFISEES